MNHAHLRFSLFLALSLPLQAQQDWWVDDNATPGGDGSSGSPMQSIQDAVDAADHLDTIRVRAGTYLENVLVHKNVRFEAVEPGVIVDGQDLAMCFRFQATDYGANSVQAVIGFTLRNGNAETWGIGGGGVSLTLSTCLIEDCIVEACHGHFGGGIYAAGGNVTIRNCVVRDCWTRDFFSHSHGGGMYLQGDNYLIEDCLFENNECANANANGGAIYVQLCNGIQFHRCEIRGNHAGLNGGGIYARDATLLLQNCNLSNNDGLEGGAAYSNTGTISLFDCAVYENVTAPGAGTVRYCIMENCVVYGNDGAGASFPVLVHNSIVRSNSGGSLLNPVSVLYSNIEGGAAGTGNIDLPAQMWAPDGGGVGGHDFHLRPGSPCIDTGDPGVPLDPDGTISDMGIDYFDANHSPAPLPYCVSHPDGSGCVAQVAGFGVASQSGATSLTLTLAGAPSNVFGLMFTGTSPAALPALGETLCINAPLKRGYVSHSGGVGTCGGQFVRQFGAAEIAAQGLSVGDSVYAQFWYRDPQDPIYTSSFSNALWFLIQP